MRGSSRTAELFTAPAPRFSVALSVNERSGGSDTELSRESVAIRIIPTHSTDAITYRFALLTFEGAATTGEATVTAICQLYRFSASMYSIVLHNSGLGVLKTVS